MAHFTAAIKKLKLLKSLPVALSMQTAFACILSNRLFQVGNQILGIFYPDTYSNQGIA